MQYLMARRVGEADVYPGVVLLVDELVEGEVELLDEFEEMAVLLWDATACGLSLPLVGELEGVRGCYVGCLSAHMLAVLCASDGMVEGLRTIAAVHDDWLSVGVA